MNDSIKKLKQKRVLLLALTLPLLSPLTMQGIQKTDVVLTYEIY